MYAVLKLDFQMNAAVIRFFGSPLGKSQPAGILLWRININVSCLAKFPSVALCPIKRGRPSSIGVALAAPHSSALHMEIYAR